MTAPGRYRVVRRIGSGGMAEVLEAVATGEAGFERRVALKRMLPGAGDVTDRDHRMFLDEARIAAQLHHANIVAVLDYGLADGAPFQVLEYVDGIDARELAKLAGGTIPITHALYICLCIGHALDHAHTAEDASGRLLGIVHRDVTPANILVSFTGDVRLTDFGIAFAHEKSEKTMAGTTKGTPWYMAPEQMLGDAVDGRTDVFSLGCVLHELVGGRSPLADEAQRFALIGGDELQLSPLLPDDVRGIVARATRHDLRQRYADARELVAALAAALAPHGVADPRSALRDWVEMLRGRATPAPAPVRGKLDALLDLAFVLEPGDTPVRKFHTLTPETRPDRVRSSAPVINDTIRDPRPPAANEPEPAPSPVPPRVVQTPEPVPEPPLARRRSRWPVIAGVALLAAVVIAVVGIATRRSDIATPPDGNRTIARTGSTARGEPARSDSASGGATTTAPSDAAISAPSDATKSSRPATVGSSDPARPQSDAKADKVVDQATAGWVGRHRRAASAFDAWRDGHADAARALRDWDARTSSGRDLLAHLAGSRDSTVAQYAASHASLQPVSVRYAADLAELATWVHDYDRPVDQLVRKGGGFPW